MRREAKKADPRLALFIRKRREELGMTQLQLAELIGARQATVSKWEAGIFPVGEESLPRIEQAFAFAERGGSLPDIEGDTAKRVKNQLLGLQQLVLPLIDRVKRLEEDMELVIKRLPIPEDDFDDDATP
jgi:transcriptional regulator with XRE-family HTH domain